MLVTRDRNEKRRDVGTRRFALSAMIALPVTVVLLFVMTQLILPGERDRVVSRIIQSIELQRAERRSDPLNHQVFNPPTPTVARIPRPSDPRPTTSVETKSSAPNVVADGKDIDWWDEARKLTQDADGESLERWLLEQGHERYVTIMQGPVPITNSVQGQLPPTQEDATGYLNTFGDMEIKVSENCIAQTQVSARLDISDFSQKLPMRIICKSTEQEEFSFDRDDLD